MRRGALCAVAALAMAAPAAAQRAPDKRLPADSPAGVQAQARLREGERLLKQDEFVAAAAAFREAVAFDPDMAMAHYGLGRARMALKEYPGAIEAFLAARAAFERRAVEIDRRYAKVDAALADSLAALATISWLSPEALTRERRARMDKLERFREERRRAVQPPPAFTLALGSAYFRTGQLADAEREWRAALAADPMLGEARINLAVVLLMTGTPADAKEELKRAKKAKARVPAGLENDIDAAIAKAKS